MVCARSPSSTLARTWCAIFCSGCWHVVTHVSWQHDRQYPNIMGSRTPACEPTPSIASRSHLGGFARAG
eukprot:12928371-Prorocentrum_lima.AAC.1